MSKPTHSESMEPSGPNGDQKPALGDSIEQRRNALRRVGQVAAAAGVASPMAALATGGRKWTCKPNSTTKVHASISGCKSVVLSAQAPDKCWGYPCIFYSTKSNVPSSCSNLQFGQIMNCAAGSYDSKTDKPYDPLNNNGCLFYKTLDEICKKYAYDSYPPVEAVFATAYCNAAKSGVPYAYSTDEVKSQWGNPSIKLDACNFHRNFGQSGS